MVELVFSKRVSQEFRATLLDRGEVLVVATCDGAVRVRDHFLHVDGVRHASHRGVPSAREQISSEPSWHQNAAEDAPAVYVHRSPVRRTRPHWGHVLLVSSEQGK